MKNTVYENVKVAAYFLWEYTIGQNAMDLWLCAEDFACYLEKQNIITIEDLRNIIKKGKKNLDYINFVRSLSYRIYLYTNNKDRAFNWFVSEKLLANSEWCAAMINVAAEFRASKGNPEALSGIRTEWIKNYYLH